MAAPSGTGSHGLQNYQMQLMLLEQQNKKRSMVARQEKESTLDCNDRPRLHQPLLIQQSDVRHGLLTPVQTPPKPSSLASSNRPLPLTGMNNWASFDPKLATKICNAASFYLPPRGVGNPTPMSPQQPFQYSIDPDTQLPYRSNGYQEYPQNPQTGLEESGESMTCLSRVSMTSSSLESMTSSDSIDTADFEVPTHSGQWDEPPDSGYEAESEDFTTSVVFWPSVSYYTNSCCGGCCGTSAPANMDLDFSASDSRNLNLSARPSGAYTDRNVDIDIRLYPQTETPPKRDESKYIANNNGRDSRARENHVSQNRNITFKSDYGEDEPTPLPHTTESANNATLGQDPTYYQRQTSSPSAMFSSGSETCSWSSDNDTDWEDDESDHEHRIGTTVVIKGSNILEEQVLPNFLTKPVLSKMKQELVDRIMVEFWQIFNQEKDFIIYEDIILRSTRLHQYQEPGTSPQGEQSTAPTSNSSTKSDIQINGSLPTNGQNGKRKRQGQDDDENDGAENRNSKRAKGLLSPPQNQDNTRKFACPYRKHDARKYCVRHWRSCALTPLDTVARVKGHLYRHHRIFPCQRCKTLFNDQQEVNDHLKKPKGCELLEIAQQDGITNEIVEILRSKKKAHRDQSEEDRWKEIYQVLFPSEMIPSPYFEEIQEDVIQSPDSQQLAEYEEYCRRELPRIFRASLEEVVNNNTQPLEEQLRSQLIDLIRDAQDRVFSSYKSCSAITTGTPTTGAPSSSPQTITSSYLSQGFPTSPLRSQPTIGRSEDSSRARLPAFFQPPSPQNHLESVLDISDRNIEPSDPNRNDQSDSGYESSSITLLCTLPLTPSDSTVNTSSSSFHSLPPLEMNQETTGHADNAQAKLDSNGSAIASGVNSYLDSGLYHQQNTFDFDFDSVDFPSFDMDNLGNCDFSQALDGSF